MNLNLEPLTVPTGTRLPGNVAALLTLIEQYMQIAGQDSFDGVKFGATTPAAEDRDKPWFKTDEDGEPIGWFAWNGATWKQIPAIVPSGNTASRPAAPTAGQLYLDTSINTLICYERGAWRTVSGSPGDIKFVATTTLAEALTANPGWLEFVPMRGRVPGGAGTSTEPDISPRTYLELAGAETVALEISEIPEHSHSVTLSNATATGVSFAADGGLHGKPGSAGAGGTTAYAPTAGTNPADGHENMTPTVFLWCIWKQ